MKKITVDLVEFNHHLEYFKKIESVDIEEIAWFERGLELKIYPEKVKDFKFMGLNNRNFPEIAGWLK